MSYPDNNNPTIEVLEYQSRLQEKSDKYLIDNSVLSSQYMTLVLGIRKYFKQHSKLSEKQRMVLIKSMLYKD